MERESFEDRSFLPGCGKAVKLFKPKPPKGGIKQVTFTDEEGMPDEGPNVRRGRSQSPRRPGLQQDGVVDHGALESNQHPP